MSKLGDAGLPDAPEGMFWKLHEIYDGHIRLALVVPCDMGDPGWTGQDYKVVKSAMVVDADKGFPQAIYPGLLVNRAQEILSWWGIMEENKKWLGEAR